MQSRADRPPPAGASRANLAQFHYDRCQAENDLGRIEDAVADCEKALELGRGTLELRELRRLEQGAALMNGRAGRNKKALEILLAMFREYDRPGTRGSLVNTSRLIVEQYIGAGDLSQADVYFRKQQAVLQDLRKGKNYNGLRRASWEGDFEQTRGRLYEARGQFKDAEDPLRKAVVLSREAIRLRETADDDAVRPPVAQRESRTDLLLARLGLVKARQGRSAEGEADIRRALLNRLKAAGKYNLQTIQIAGILADLLISERRFAEA